MSTTELIQHSLAKHSQLLRSITELDYAPVALEEATSHLEYLTNKKDDAERRLAKRARITDKKRKEYLALQDSAARKWTNRLMSPSHRSNNRKPTNSKEELEYLDSLEREQEGEGIVEMLTEEHRKSTQSYKIYKSAFERREGFLWEVDELYNSIFMGRTPEFPVEDQLETDFLLAEGEHERAQKRLSVMGKGLSSLNEAKSMMVDCMKRMDQAGLYSNLNSWQAANMRNGVLSNAQLLLTQVKLLVTQAQQFDPAVNEMPNVRIPQMAMTTHYSLEGAVMSMQMLEHIQNAQGPVRDMDIKLQQEICAAEGRCSLEDLNLSASTERLAQARLRLRSEREAAFLIIAERGAPPPFSDSEEAHPAADNNAAPVMAIATSNVTASDSGRNESDLPGYSQEI